MRESFTKNSKENFKNDENQKELFCSTFQKSSVTKKLRSMMENNENCTVMIKIDEWTFECHLIVLQCYSKLFKRHSFERGTIVELPKEHVSNETFMTIYKWMLEDDPLVERTEIVQLLIAACYLEIDYLVAQIWHCLNNMDDLREDAAYFLYLEASQLEVKCLRKTMLTKISRFFLTMVAFKEFLQMPIGDLRTLIGSDKIGVNTEIEIFMSVLRWLSYDWSNRKKYIFRLMINVRFHLIPPGFLIELDRNMIEINVVKRVMTRQKVRDLVSNGLKDATTRLCYGKFISQSSSIKERRWIYDGNCEYHLKGNQLIEYKITYGKFYEYLNCLQKCHQNYWHKLVDIGPISTSPTSCSESRQLRDSEMSCVMKVLTDNETSGLTASTTYLTVEQSYASSQATTSSDEKPIRTILNRDNVQNTTLCEYKKDKNDIFHEHIDELQKLTHRIRASSGESTRSISSVCHYQRQSSDSSISTIDSISILDKSNGCEVDYNEQVSHHSGDVSQEEEIEQNDQNSETSSFISILSVGKLTKSVYKSDSLMQLSVKSVSQTTCLASIEKTTTKAESKTNFTQTQPIVNEKHHRFDFKNVNLKEIFSNLDQSMKKSNSNLISKNKNKKSENVKKSIEKRKKNFSKEDVEDAPNVMLPALINSHDMDYSSINKSLFKNKTLLILGGSDPYNQYEKSPIDTSDKILFYSNRFQKWAQLRHSSFSTRQHHAAVVCNGLVYIIGGTKWVPGCKLTIFETAIWVLNTKTKKWNFETNLPKNRRDFAVIVVDGELNEPGFFIIGGESFDKMPLNSVWFYNVAKKIWLRKASLNRPRYGFSASIVNNEIWIAGGITQESNAIQAVESKKVLSVNFSRLVTDSIETFKLADGLGQNKGKWIDSKLCLGKPCLFGKLLAVEGKNLFLIGGIGPDDEGNLHSYDTIDRFDFGTKKWFQCAKLNDARHGHEALSINEFIAIIGGVSSKRKCALESIETFCVQTNQVQNVIPNLPRPLSGLAAVVVEGEW